MCSNCLGDLVHKDTEIEVLRTEVNFLKRQIKERDEYLMKTVEMVNELAKHVLDSYNITKEIQ